MFQCHIRFADLEPVMTFWKKPRMKTRLAALCGSAAGATLFSPLTVWGSINSVGPGQPFPSMAGVIAFGVVLGCTLAAGIAFGHQESEPTATARENLDEAATARPLNSTEPPAHQDVYEPANLLQTLLENSPDQIYFKDRQSRFVCYSRSFRKLLRLEDASSLKGKTDFDIFSEEHARRAFNDEQEIIRTGQPLIAKLERETHTDGRVTWALTTKLPWPDQSGNIVGTFGISKNVTSIEETKRKLAYERELFQALVENLPDAIYFKDLDSRFVKLSRSKVERARQQLLQRHRQEHGRGHTEQLAPHLASTEQCAAWLIGKSDFDLCTPAHAQLAFNEEQQIIRTGQPLVGKVERLEQDGGTPAWFLTTKMPWHDREGRIIGTFGVTRNITALKEAEAQLEETSKRLAHTSRLAGMAEVASDVLHNVGNVLNSVNISCSVVMDRVQSSDLDNLARIPALLREHAGQLDQFLTTDPRGKQIPDYLTAVADEFAGQRQFLLAELEQLRQHIDHIKQVVATQQNYAKVSGVCEVVAVDKLVADALQINASALDRHSVTLREEYEPVPPILVDKHKVLQILVNLINNAKYAVTDGPHPEKLLTLRVAPEGRDQIRIEVEDNGIGIPAENLTRIFGHGFTTRRDGHGFGLHSGALAARELGGSLSAASAGAGHGATFTLRLPVKPPTRASA